MARKRLGEVLLEDGLIDHQDLAEALKYKEKSGYRLGTALVALRIIAEWQLTEALGKALGLPVIDLVATPPAPSAIELVPAQLAERHDLIPVRLEGRESSRELVIAMSDPLNRTLIRKMREVCGFPIRPALAGLAAIQRAIRQHYHGAEASQTFLKAERLRKKRPARKKRAALLPAEVRLNALLKLLIHKGIISEDEYVQTLLRILDPEDIGAGP